MKAENEVSRKSRCEKGLGQEPTEAAPRTGGRNGLRGDTSPAGLTLRQGKDAQGETGIDGVTKTSKQDSSLGILPTF
jgi:hypothetical protein